MIMKMYEVSHGVAIRERSCKIEKLWFERQSSAVATSGTGAFPIALHSFASDRHDSFFFEAGRRIFVSFLFAAITHKKINGCNTDEGHEGL
jgi:hypothetical protein